MPAKLNKTDSTRDQKTGEPEGNTLPSEQQQEKKLESALVGDIRKLFHDEIKGELEGMKKELAALEGMRKELAALGGMKEELGGMKEQLGGMNEDLGRVKEELGGMKEQLGALTLVVEDQSVRALRQDVRARFGEPYSRHMSVDCLSQLALMLPELLLTPDENLEIQAVNISVDICKDLLERKVHLAFFSDLLSHYGSTKKQEEYDPDTFGEILGESHPLLLKQIIEFHDRLKDDLYERTYHMIKAEGLGLVLTIYDACGDAVFSAEPILQFDVCGSANLYCREKSKLVTGRLEVGECTLIPGFPEVFHRMSFKLKLLHWFLVKALTSRKLVPGNISKVGRLFVHQTRLNHTKKVELVKEMKAAMVSNRALELYRNSKVQPNVLTSTLVLGACDSGEFLDDGRADPVVTGAHVQQVWELDAVFHRSLTKRKLICCTSAHAQPSGNVFSSENINDQTRSNPMQLEALKMQKLGQLVRLRSGTRPNGVEAHSLPKGAKYVPEARTKEEHLDIQRPEEYESKSLMNSSLDRINIEARLGQE